LKSNTVSSCSVACTTGPIDGYLEACSPDRFQVVPKSLVELLDEVHFEGEAEIFGQLFDLDVVEENELV